MNAIEKDLKNIENFEYKGASQAAIQHHYDVSNKFYQLWLDRTLTYSCALWEDRENEDIELAQIRKIDFHINQAKASGANSVLEIGCGWGSTLKRLVEFHQVKRVTGLTLSQAQAEWISGFNSPQIEVRLENWSAHSPAQPYDAIISIGAFEHFARQNISKAEKIENYRQFFRCCHQWLKPGCWLSLQTIAYENRPALASEFSFDIFPESNSPRLAEIAEASERIFEIVAVRNDRKHYERTCRIWLSRLKANRAAAIQEVGEETVARYEKYLKMAIIGFYTSQISLLRLSLRRLDNPQY